MSLLTDPKLFNYVVIALFAASAVRWTYEGQYIQAIYWTGAILCTLGVTIKA